MKIKRIITCAVVLALGVSLFAQERRGPVKPVRFGVAVTAGSNGYASISAQPGTLSSYGAEAKSVQWTDKATAFGIEGSLLISDAWKIDLGGTFNFAYNPGYQAVPGTGTGLGDIPDYQAVALQQSVVYQVYLGAGYSFRIPAVPALRPYVGIRGGVSYANNQKLLPEVEAMGVSVGENYNIYAGVVGGVDYYLGSNFYIGGAVDFFRFIYGVTAYAPQEGLGALSADSFGLGFLAAPRIKVGFLF